ncbi:hypothetical protein D3C85_274330 [compost metagenome]
MTIQEQRRKGFEECFPIPHYMEWKETTYFLKEAKKYSRSQLDAHLFYLCTWSGWNAAMDSVCVELPGPCEAIDIAYFNADVIDAIHAAGVRTK